MADADERTDLDRRKKSDDVAEDAREEYTGYGKEGTGHRSGAERSGEHGDARRRADDEAEAEREADLQPDSPTSP